MTKTERRRELERLHGNTAESERRLHDLYRETVGAATQPDISWLEKIEAILGKVFPGV